MDWRVRYLALTERVFREGSLPRLVSFACRKLISPWIENGDIEFFCRDLEDAVPNCVPGIDVFIREAHPDDIPLILSLYGSARCEDKIRKRFQGGDRCFMAINRAGEAVHATWFSNRFARVPELNLKLLLTSGEVYTYDLYTQPAVRRRGIDSAVRSFAYRQLGETGYNKLYLYVCRENLAGLRAAQRWLDPAGSVRYWKSSLSADFDSPLPMMLQER
jgi:ribosomal protein S18 acetylase RimI-like enzyme